MAGTNNFGPLEGTMLQHLDAAFNLARWLTLNREDAEDLVQEAFLRASNYCGGFRSEDARIWVLRLVRNAWYTRVQQHHAPDTAFEEKLHSEKRSSVSPEGLLLRSASSQLVRKALEDLPVKFREILVLRELERLSYQEIADVAEISLDAVMSGLSYARERLQQSLTKPGEQDRSHHPSKRLVPAPC